MIEPNRYDWSPEGMRERERGSWSSYDYLAIRTKEHAAALAAKTEECARWITAVECFVEHRDCALEPFDTREWLELIQMLDAALTAEEKS